MRTNASLQSRSWPFVGDEHTLLCLLEEHAVFLLQLSARRCRELRGRPRASAMLAVGRS